MFRRSFQTLAIAAFAAFPLAASAHSTGETLLPSQSVIGGTLEQKIDSRTANALDPFVLDVQAPYPADDQRYAGGRVYGHVATVAHAGGTKKGEVTLAFDRLVLADGTAASLQGQVVSLDAQTNKSNKTAKTIAGAVVGQILGNYVGKHIGTDVGGAVGAIGGGLYAANTGQNITIPQGSSVSMKTTAPATVLARRQAPYPSPTP
ncbi:MAG: hypothetical protein NVSMB64_10420 [Candidatus Velthaea sp.]